jgi:hypothetical protein
LQALAIPYENQWQTLLRAFQGQGLQRILFLRILKNEAKPLKDQGGQNGFLQFWAGHCECILFLDFLKLFLLVDIDDSFPMSRSMQHLDSRFMS